LTKAVVLARNVAALVDVVLTRLPVVARGAHAKKIVQLVDAGGAVLAGVRRAFIRLDLAVEALPSRFTHARVVVELVEARGAVLTYTTGELISGARESNMGQE
jgi:hypothetical protein